MTEGKLADLCARLEAEPAGPRRRVLELAAEALAAELGAAGGLAGACGAVLARAAPEAGRLQAGETRLWGWFVGQVRKEMGGKGDPAAIKEYLGRILGLTSGPA